MSRCKGDSIHLPWSKNDEFTLVELREEGLEFKEIAGL